MSALAPLDEKENLLGKIPGLVPVVDFWGHIGFPDDRHFATKSDHHPFDAVVRVITTRQSKPFQCAGFFALSSQLVITAAHCFDPERELIAEINIERSKSLDQIPARVVARGKYDENDERKSRVIEDWAILKLDREPKLPVRPLHFATTSAWSKRAYVDFIVVGYPGDLKYGQRSVGFYAPSVSSCRQYASQVEFLEDGTQIMHSQSCATWYGNSGGPALTWDENSKEYRVLGVNIHLWGRLNIGQILQGADPDHELLRQHWNAIGGARSSLAIGGDDWMLIPGVSRPSHMLAVLDRGKDATSVLPLRVEMQHAAYRAAGLTRPTQSQKQAVQELLRERDGWAFYPFFDVKAERKLLHYVRRYCVTDCSDKWLDPVHQLRARPGETLEDAEQLRSAGVAGVLAPLEMLSRYDRKLHAHYTEGVRNREDWSKWEVVLIGGDLYLVERDSKKILAIQRRFMNFTRDGDELVRVYMPRWWGDDDPDNLVKTGIPATTELRKDRFGAPTPDAVDGARLIGTRELWRKLSDKKPPLVISVIPEKYGLPHAVRIPQASQGGTFNDKVQNQLDEALRVLTRGDKHKEMVFYCHHVNCWMSYNAVLRAVSLGYRNVLWYRHGLAGWIDAGYPLSDVLVVQ